MTITPTGSSTQPYFVDYTSGAEKRLPIKAVPRSGSGQTSHLANLQLRPEDRLGELEMLQQRIVTRVASNGSLSGFFGSPANTEPKAESPRVRAGNTPPYAVEPGSIDPKGEHARWVKDHASFRPENSTLGFGPILGYWSYHVRAVADSVAGYLNNKSPEVRKIVLDRTFAELSVDGRNDILITMIDRLATKPGLADLLPSYLVELGTRALSHSEDNRRDAAASAYGQLLIRQAVDKAIGDPAKRALLAGKSPKEAAEIAYALASDPVGTTGMLKAISSGGEPPIPAEVRKAFAEQFLFNATSALWANEGPQIIDAYTSAMFPGNAQKANAEAERLKAIMTAPTVLGYIGFVSPQTIGTLVGSLSPDNRQKVFAAVLADPGFPKDPYQVMTKLAGLLAEEPAKDWLIDHGAASKIYKTEGELKGVISAALSPKGGPKASDAEVGQVFKAIIGRVGEGAEGEGWTVQVLTGTVVTSDGELIPYPLIKVNRGAYSAVAVRGGHDYDDFQLANDAIGKNVPTGIVVALPEGLVLRANQDGTVPLAVRKL
jgi:hypothetical protein